MYPYKMLGNVIVVITGAERRQRPKKVELGNQEWVTVIETIMADDTWVTPLIIFPGKVHQLV
jgi:hypothetical protein